MCFFFSNGRKISAKSVTSLVLWMGLSRNDLIRAAPLPISKKYSRICVYICLNKSMSQKDLHFGFIFVRVLNLNLILNLEFTVELTQVFCYLSPYNYFSRSRVSSSIINITACDGCRHIYHRRPTEKSQRA